METNGLRRWRPLISVVALGVVPALAEPSDDENCFCWDDDGLYSCCISSTSDDCIDDCQNDNDCDRGWPIEDLGGGVGCDSGYLPWSNGECDGVGCKSKPPHDDPVEIGWRFVVIGGYDFNHNQVVDEDECKIEDGQCTEYHWLHK